jgi:starvation-inducible DNA-binding protein
VIQAQVRRPNGAKRSKSPPTSTPRRDLSVAAMNRISAALNNILADTFALYLKTKNFHWHVSE